MIKRIDFDSFDIDKKTKLEIEEDIKDFNINLSNVDYMKFQI